MSEQQYARKAIEEVIRLSDDKILQVEDLIIKRGEDLTEYANSCDETIKDLGHYFVTLVKQLEKWKSVFVQDIQKNTADMGNEYRNKRNKVQELIEKLRELREKASNALNTGNASNSELVYQIHSCIFNINQEVESLTDFTSECLPLKFVGKINFEMMQKNEIGSLEKLSDLSAAEILPSKLPKIKLGQLFNLEFRISNKYCEAAKRFIKYSVTKDSESFQKVCAYLQDNKNGTYTLSFPITAIIPHTVNVCYLGEHIRNSPYTIVFKVGPNQGNTGATQQGQPQPLNPTTSKEASLDYPGKKQSGRAMGDERENLKRNKWQAEGSMQQHKNELNNNDFKGNKNLN